MTLAFDVEDRKLVFAQVSVRDVDRFHLRQIWLSESSDFDALGGSMSLVAAKLNDYAASGANTKV